MKKYISDMDKIELEYITACDCEEALLVLDEILCNPYAISYINILDFYNIRGELLVKFFNYCCLRNMELFDITLYLFINNAFDSVQILNNIGSETPFPFIDLNNKKIRNVVNESSRNWEVFGEKQSRYFYTKLVNDEQKKPKVLSLH